MVTINVRRLDEDVVERLKRRASSNNRSLEGEARHILQCAADDDMAAKRATFLEASARLRGKDQGSQADPGGSADSARTATAAHRDGLLMRFVVDASVAVKWLVEEPDSDAALALAESGEELHAPRLMASEVANALWRKARLGQIERADASAALPWAPRHAGALERRRDRQRGRGPSGVGPRSPGLRLHVSRARAPHRGGRADGGPSIRDGRCLDRA